FGERIRGLPRGRGTSIDCLTFPIKEPTKPPQRFADIHPNILSLTGPVSPQRRHGDGFGGQTDRGHAAKPEGARNDRIAAVKADFAAAIRSRHSHTFLHLIDCSLHSDIPTPFTI